MPTNVSGSPGGGNVWTGDSTTYNLVFLCLLRIKEDKGVEDTPYAPEHGLPFRSFCKLSIGGGGSCCELFYRWDTDPTVTYINAKHIFTANMSHMDVPNAIPEILRLRLSVHVGGLNEIQVCWIVGQQDYQRIIGDIILPNHSWSMFDKKDILSKMQLSQWW